MKHLRYTSSLLIILLTLSISHVKAQIITDIFNNLIYKDPRGNYSAKLEKNIFNDLNFSDNKNNKVVFSKSFLSNINPQLLSNNEAQRAFFMNQIKTYIQEANNNEEYTVDIFKAWKYQSKVDNFKASFEKDIFDSWIYSDNKGNKITYEKKYLDQDKKININNSQNRGYFFLDLTAQYRKEKNYIATYSVDIFNKIIIKDNRGYQYESDLKDFNNPIQIDPYPLQTEEIDRNIRGNEVKGYDFAFKNKRARLKQNSNEKWIYTDSEGNRFEFGANTWKRLNYTYRTTKELFQYLLEQYL